jgi:hypothetical protein
MDERGVNAASKGSAMTKCFFSHIFQYNHLLYSLGFKMTGEMLFCTSFCVHMAQEAND